jgi:zinc transporter
MTNSLNWKHLNFSIPVDADWIRQESGIPDIVKEAMLDTETRPRMLQTDEGLLVILRGVNQNTGAALEDMVSVRVWIEPDRVVSTSRRPLVSIREIRAAIDAGKGPVTSRDFLVALIERLSDFINEAIEKIEDKLDEAEDKVTNSADIARNSPFSVLRRQTARMRRHLGPQREALDRLSRLNDPILDAGCKSQLHEQANRLMLILEDLDLVRERAMLAQEEFLGIVAHEQNSRMFVLSVVAAIFLPLSFLTGLMGMNVAGLPGLEYQWAFWILVLIMLVTSILILIVFRIKKWF